MFLALSGEAQGGPLLICRTFEIGPALSLPWGSPGGWDAVDPAYDVRRVPDDVVRLLDPSMPILVRMETLRRATLYVSSHPQIASTLLSRLVARTRAGHTTPDPMAWFDAGYLVESFIQGGMGQNSELVMVKETYTIDGYAWIQRALRELGDHPDMHCAAALAASTRRDRRPIGEAHLRLAEQGAVPGTLLAVNLAVFHSGASSLVELRTGALPAAVKR